MPFKFETILNNCSDEPEKYKHGLLKKQFIDDKGFDPNGFFFLTYRSNAIGLTFALPTAPNEYRIVYLCCIPSHRNKEVREALLVLLLKHYKSKGAVKITVPAPS